MKSRKSTIRRSFLAAAIVVAGPVAGIGGFAGPASAAPVARAVPVKAAMPAASALPASRPAPAALAGISCTSATFCMAVGGTSATMSTQVAAEDWTGAWHRLTIGKPGGVSYVGLSAVSCPSATECVAVGRGTDKKSGNWVPVAETWTRSGGGNLWQVQLPATLQPFEALFYTPAGGPAGGGASRRMRSRLESPSGLGYAMVAAIAPKCRQNWTTPFPSSKRITENRELGTRNCFLIHPNGGKAHVRAKPIR